MGRPTLDRGRFPWAELRLQATGQNAYLADAILRAPGGPETDPELTEPLEEEEAGEPMESDAVSPRHRKLLDDLPDMIERAEALKTVGKLTEYDAACAEIAEILAELGPALQALRPPPPAPAFGDGGFADLAGLVDPPEEPEEEEVAMPPIGDTPPPETVYEGNEDNPLKRKLPE